MKLLFCPSCHDVQGLVMQYWRMCICGKSGGQYNEDGMTATLGGESRVLGIGNPFFDYMYKYLDEPGKHRMWQDLYGHQSGDCWWGEYEDDAQIFRVEDANGPRLKITVIPVSGTDQKQRQNKIIVREDRDFWYKGTKHNANEELVTHVPANSMVEVNKKVTRWNHSWDKVKNENRRDKSVTRKQVRKGK